MPKPKAGKIPTGFEQHKHTAEDHPSICPYGTDFLDQASIKSRNVDCPNYFFRLFDLPNVFYFEHVFAFVLSDIVTRIKSGHSMSLEIRENLENHVSSMLITWLRDVVNHAVSHTFGMVYVPIFPKICFQDGLPIILAAKLSVCRFVICVPESCRH